MASAAATPPYLLRGRGSTGYVYQIRKDIEDQVIAKCPALQIFRTQQPNTHILFKILSNEDARTEYNEYTKALAGVYDPSYGVSLIICICNATQLIDSLALDPATQLINSLKLDPATHKALVLVDSGMSLYDYLNTNQNGLTLAQLRYLISQFHRIIAVLTSLQHNDIKIQNIVVQINAENKATPFIIDFGLTGDIQDNFLGSLSYPVWSLEIGAFILKTNKYPPSVTNKERMEWFLTTDIIRPYLFKETNRDSWVQFLIDNKIIVSSSGIVLSNNSVEIRNYLIDQMKEGMRTEIKESEEKREDFETFRTRIFHKSDVFSLGIIFMQIYNANKNNKKPGVEGYLERFKSMFLPMLYANVYLRPNWRQVESEFASTVSVTARERRRQRSRCRTRKTQR
jgi:serine/threonine protein kinase